MVMPAACRSTALPSLSRGVIKPPTLHFSKFRLPIGRLPIGRLLLAGCLRAGCLRAGCLLPIGLLAQVKHEAVVGQLDVERLQAGLWVRPQPA